MQNDDLHLSCDGCGPVESSATASGIGRRTFLAQAAMLAAAAALAACGAGADNVTAPPSGINATLKVSDYPALGSVGGIAMVNISGYPFAVVRTGTSTFVTLSRICPHAGSTVNQSGSGFLCPNHGARFAADGTWVGGQPTGSLQSFPTTYDASTGTISIT